MIMFEDGKMFDGSSISGWKGINESDMILMPDPSSAVMDIFADEATLNLFVARLSSRQPCRATIAARALLPTALRRTSNQPALLTPLTSVRRMSSSYSTASPGMTVWKARSTEIGSDEGAWASGDGHQDGNVGHRPGVKGGYFPVPPVDSLHDIRSSMCLAIEELGVETEVHHHEVATAGQCEIGTKFNTLKRKADEVQIMKYARAQRCARVRQDRYVYAEAARWRQRQRHARASVAVQRW